MRGIVGDLALLRLPRWTDQTGAEWRDSGILLYRRCISARGRLTAAIQLSPRKRLIFLPIPEGSICANLGQRYSSYAAGLQLPRLPESVLDIETTPVSFSFPKVFVAHPWGRHLKPVTSVTVPPSECPCMILAPP
jgi:hypothetical protein